MSASLTSLLLALAISGSDPEPGSVEQALQWIAAQQHENGSWNFTDENSGGNLKNANNAATAFSILPFLGAGQTHQEGRHKKLVHQGLKYLLENMKVEDDAGSLADEGTGLYAHAWGTLVLCEAYAMTGDKELLRPAQLAVRHIANTQDETSGGWSYHPGKGSNTILAAWNILALKCAHMGYLEVPPETIRKCHKFLDLRQQPSEDAETAGSRYGFTRPGASEEATAAAIACRRLLGWKHDDPRAVSAITFATAKEPSQDELSRTFFTTLATRYQPQETFTPWNKQMREHLVDAQIREGSDKGSWRPAMSQRGGIWGGRLYCTSCAVLSLEVYYRHLSIFEPLSTPAEDDDFPL